VHNLNQLYQRASLEARTDSKDQSVFGAHLGRFIKGLTEFTDGLTGNGVFGFNPDLKRVSSKEDYMAVRNKNVYRPIHLKSGTSMVDFVELIKSNFEAQEDLEKRVLAPWRGILANFLTNPGELGKIYDIKELTKGKLFKLSPLEDMEKDLKKVYNPNSSQPTEMFGKLYRNAAEWKDTCNITAKLNERAVALNFASLIEQATELNEMASRLADNIFNNPEEYATSKSAMQLLTEGSYIIGKELEFLGATGSMLDAISGAVASTTDVLKK